MPMPRLPLDWRVVVLGLLGVWFVVTTLTAESPAAAWGRLAELSKVFVSLLLTVLLIDSRETLSALLVTIAVSIALVTVKGGYWAVLRGFSDRVYGPPGSHFYDNNHFAVLVLMNIPLLLLMLREAKDRRLMVVLAAVVVLSVGSALSSWSRGGLIACAVTALAVLWWTPRRWLGLGVLGAGAMLAYLALPGEWMERMATIGSYEQVGSAVSRMRVWQAGVEYALENPWLGAGFEGWRFVNADLGEIDWHNAYVEILAEHGFIGLALWLGLLGGTIVSLVVAAGTAEHRAHDWSARYAAALAASLLAYSAGAMFVGISYWDVWFHLALVSVVLSRTSKVA
jgi:probable O-glycosylation ligase (exosortase A-associated)